MMRRFPALAAVALLAAVPSPAGATPPSGEEPAGSRFAANSAKRPSSSLDYSTGNSDVTVSFGVAGRVAFPNGTVDNHSPDLGVPGAIVLPERMRYSDLFNPGFGATVDASLLFETAPATGGSYGVQKGVGFYVAAQADYFDGGRISYETDNVLRPDRMNVLTGFAGFKGVAALGSDFYGDFRLGAGTIHFDDVKAELTTTGPATTSFLLFQSTWQFAAETRVHAGYRAGPLSVGLGGGIRMNTGAEASEDALSTWLDPKRMWIYDVEIALELAF
jgi:hypothetical protein